MLPSINWYAVARRLQFLRQCAILLCISLCPALADEDLIHGEVNLLWWSNDFSANALDASFDVGAVGAEAEVWWSQRWGIKANLYKSDTLENNSGDGPDYLSVDFKRRVISVTRNNFLALGLGWESVDLAQGAQTQGPRLLIQGGLGVTPILSVYGHTAWMPAMDQTERLEDPSALEVEAGIAISPFPYLSFRAGYRVFQLDFKSLQGANETSKSRGVILGAGITF